jgi:DNA-binding NarL/FixJ family response regulator
MSQTFGTNTFSSPTHKETVIVVDAMEIRRSSIVSLLDAWADSEHLHLTPIDFEHALKDIEGNDLCLIVFNVGGDPIANTDTMHYLVRIKCQFPEIPLVIMSDNLLVNEVSAALFVGAVGYLHSGGALQLAMHALSFIIKGGSYFPVSVLREMQRRTEDDNGPSANGDEKQSTGGSSHSNGGDGADQETLALEIANKPCNLTPRQIAVLECLCHGDSNKLIARRLSVSETTVKLHVRQIMRKLGAANRTQAAVLICSGHNASLTAA